MKNWNEVFEENLIWNGESGDEIVKGTYEFESESDKEDFHNSEVDDCWYWEIEEMIISFHREAN